MTDLEMTRLCAEAMTLKTITIYLNGWPQVVEKGFGSVDMITKYDPLHDDTQAMALVKKWDLHIGKTLRTPEQPRGSWFVSRTDKYEVVNTDLNRAICECVAKMQQAKLTK